jgi:hypothetical protein
MSAKITCDFCARDITDAQHVAVSFENVSPESWGDHKPAHYCNLYRCLYGDMQRQAAKFHWHGGVTTSPPPPKPEALEG